MNFDATVSSTPGANRTVRSNLGEAMLADQFKLILDNLRVSERDQELLENEFNLMSNTTDIILLADEDYKDVNCSPPLRSKLLNLAKYYMAYEQFPPADTTILRLVR